MIYQRILVNNVIPYASPAKPTAYIVWNAYIMEKDMRIAIMPVCAHKGTIKMETSASHVTHCVFHAKLKI